MKKFSKDERKGAIALAVVVIVIMGGMAFFRSCVPESPSETPGINIIYTDKDSAASDYETEEFHSRHKSRKTSGRKKSGSSSRTKNSSSRKSGTSGKSVNIPDPPRDFLSDTIPVEYEEEYN